MLHRLYLSAFWLLAAFGVLVTSGVTLVQVHDHFIVAGDRACFLAAKERALTKAHQVPKQPSGSWRERTRDVEPFDPDAYLRKTAPREPATEQRSGSGRGKSTPEIDDWEDVPLQEQRSGSGRGEEIDWDALPDAPSVPKQRSGSSGGKSPSPPRFDDIEGELLPPTPTTTPAASYRPSSWVPDGRPLEQQCNVHRYSDDRARTWEMSEYYSARAWFKTSLLSMAEPLEIAASALAFVPLILLVLLRRWILWVRFGSGAPPT